MGKEENMRLRGYLIIGAFCVLCFIVWTAVSSGAVGLAAQDIAPKGESYTTDAEISPYDLFIWESVFVSKPTEEGVYYIVAENPLLRTPVDCYIKYALLRVSSERGKLTGYAYYVDRKLQVYELQAVDETLSSGRFVEVKIEGANRKIIDYYLLRFLGWDSAQWPTPPHDRGWPKPRMYPDAGWDPYPAAYLQLGSWQSDLMAKPI